MDNTVTWETLYWFIAALATWGGLVAVFVWRACSAIEQIKTRLAVIEAMMKDTK